MLEIIQKIILYLAGFGIVALAADRLAQYFTKWKAPMITGLLLVGIVTGPYVLDLLDKETVSHLGFLNDFSLAFIALAAGVELYLKELNDSLKSIKWNTLSQLFITFGMTSLAMFYLADFIPFMQEMNVSAKIAVAILVGTIFVARSPSSAIAIINELRAKGPFVRISLGVTVVKDILVIILFSICLSLSMSLIQGVDLEWMLLVKIIGELILSFGLGWLVGKLLVGVLKTTLSEQIKTILILGIGFGVFQGLHFMEDYIHEHYHITVRVEALLVVLLGSFYVTNYSKHRLELQEMMEHNGPWVYVIFFTLTGASLSLDVLANVWEIALVLFVIRLVSMMIGSFVGGTLAGDKPLFRKYGWMPYVTQAGVGIGLSTEIAATFPEWGNSFYTIVVAVIVINQIVGPPLFKYAIQKVGEAHVKAKTTLVEGQEAIIFGLENHSIALARRLREHHWDAKIVTTLDAKDFAFSDDVPIVKVKDFSEPSILALKPESADKAILLLSDERNFNVAEILYEKAGTESIVVRVNDFSWSSRFERLGAYIVNPGLAMVSLLDHYVRSPLTTSLLLGKEGDRDSLDVKVKDARMDGVLLRDLRLPSDVIILSVKRGDEMVITHGYTKLHVGDTLTFVGSEESLEEVSLMCQNFKMSTKSV